MIRGRVSRVLVPVAVTAAAGAALAGCGNGPPVGMKWSIPRETLSGPSNTSVVKLGYTGKKPIPDVTIGAQLAQSFAGKWTDYYSADIQSVSGDARCRLVRDKSNNGLRYVDCGRMVSGESLRVSVTFNDSDANEVWIAGPNWSDVQGLTK